MTLALAPAPAAALRSAAAIRERCGNITKAVGAGHSNHFRIDRTRLDHAAQRVVSVTRERYPTLAVPYHSRWRHFEAGGVDRRAELDHALAGHTVAHRARAQIDLAVVSVLLDAGAGPAWRFDEVTTGQRFGRSEGLGVASFRAFMAGAFSAQRDDPYRADASALEAIDAASLGALFQVRADNPLTGLDGRAALLRRLGATLAQSPAALGDAKRPGGLFDRLSANGAARVDATRMLDVLLDGLSPIWLTGSALEGVALGDTWRHPQAGGTGPSAGWVPFHKLSQWLTYSLFEPFEWAGVAVSGQDALTGLPEYRNGGLLIDTGVLALRDAAAADTVWRIDSELVVEWRALTVVLLDELAARVRAMLGAPAMPLACVLEGGTWAAGRLLAQERRGGVPPLFIDSDGTVF